MLISHDGSSGHEIHIKEHKFYQQKNSAEHGAYEPSVTYIKEVFYTQKMQLTIFYQMDWTILSEKKAFSSIINWHYNQSLYM